MEKIEKVLNISISAVVAVMFLLNSTVYGISLQQDTCLRTPLEFQSSHHDRYAAALKKEEEAKNEQFKEKLFDTIFSQGSSLPLLRVNGAINLKDEQGKNIELTNSAFLQKEGEDYFTTSLEIEKVWCVDTENLGKLYLIEDTNGNTFQVGEDGKSLAVAVRIDSGIFFIALDRLHAQRLLLSLKKAWDDFNGPKDSKLKGRFLYTSAFFDKDKQEIINTISKNPCLAHLFGLVLKDDGLNELRLSGGSLVTDKYDYGGMYVPRLELIFWQGRVLKIDVLAHELMHHIFSKNKAIYNLLKDYMKEHHQELLKRIKEDPLYKNLDEKTLINEAVAYLFSAIVTGSAKTHFGTSVYYSDLQAFKELGLLPEAYFPSELIEVFQHKGPAEAGVTREPVQQEFFGILKGLYDARFENLGRSLPDALFEYAHAKGGDNYKRLFILARILAGKGNYDYAGTVYEKIIEGPEYGTDQKILAMFAFANLKKNLVAKGKDPEGGKNLQMILESLTGRIEALLKNKDNARKFLTTLLEMNAGYKELKAMFLNIDEKGLLKQSFLNIAKDIKKDIKKMNKQKVPGVAMNVEQCKSLLASVHRLALALFLPDQNVAEARIMEVETNKRLDKARGQAFLEKYPIVAVLRRMRHGGSVYDIKKSSLALFGSMGMLEKNIPPGSPKLSNDFNELQSQLKTTYSNLKTMIDKVPVGINSREVSNQVPKWENGLKEALDSLEGFRLQFNGFEKQFPYNTLDDQGLEEAKSAVEQSNTVIGTMIDILKQGIDLANGRVVKETTDINKIVKEAIESSGISKEIKFREADIPHIFADPTMVRQMVTNILNNARNLLDEAGITEITIALKLSRNKKDLIIEITDNGNGFPYKMLSHIEGRGKSREVIFGLDMTYRKGGTGFGLAENEYYARLHGGSFSIVSRLSGKRRGSIFTIRLPVSQETKTSSALIEKIKKFIHETFTTAFGAQSLKTSI